MKKHWNEVQPVDRYIVGTSGLLDEYERKTITFLYQPLIGATCFSLYMTLWSEVEKNRLWSEESTHYQIMNFLSLNLQEVYDARLKLEGIGLLKSFVKESETGERVFIYELQPPLTPKQFFNDGMLNVYLYRKIGKTHFQKLKKFFSDERIDLSQYKESTRSFQDVYSTMEIDLMNQDAEEASSIKAREQYIGKTTSKGVPLDQVDFNFDILLSGLSQSMVPRKSFTPLVKETILKLSNLYGIDAVTMKNVVLSALNEEDRIDIEALRKTARDWYQMNHGDKLPDLTSKIQPNEYRNVQAEPSSKEEELIHYLESTSPKDLLKDISGGGEPSKSDLQAIEGVMFAQKLSAGVVNVLIQYVLLKTDMKLSKGYIDKIASHWARKKVKTVQEAMELAKNEHRQYLSWAEGKNEKKSTNRKPIRTEKLPDWFNDSNGNEKTSEKEQVNFEEEKKKLEEELKNFRK
ncbi:replication initiation and membrane attachment family protein [Rossellomorea sp. BNER]|uniref:replication initiation and membrane attachment family protein n=1 Tax=Rossellomorea sp. BNER TaxID=2962031 RepID=UPI003AF28F81|nr:replication initiation and membrane attachment family protein [Rossellomorea sp. BNER]